jgi:hypothetical protein
MIPASPRFESLLDFFILLGLTWVSCAAILLTWATAIGLRLRGQRTRLSSPLSLSRFLLTGVGVLTWSMFSAELATALDGHWYTLIFVVHRSIVYAYFCIAIMGCVIAARLAAGSRDRGKRFQGVLSYAFGVAFTVCLIMHIKAVYLDS